MNITVNGCEYNPVGCPRCTAAATFDLVLAVSCVLSRLPRKKDRVLVGRSELRQQILRRNYGYPIPQINCTRIGQVTGGLVHHLPVHK